MSMVKTSEEIALMREAGRRLATVMEACKEMSVEGTNLLEIDKKAGEIIEEFGDEILFKGYQGFPANICLSLNDVVVHGYAEDYALQEGDVLSIDMGLRHKGWCADMARTVIVGEQSDEVKQLVADTQKVFEIMADAAKDGATTGDLGALCEEYCAERGYGIVVDLAGHGIGKNLHEEPSVPNFGEEGTGILLKEGMTIAIEPMLNLGTYKVVFDDWHVRTADGALSAHYENTVLVGKERGELLTQI